MGDVQLDEWCHIRVITNYSLSLEEMAALDENLYPLKHSSSLTRLLVLVESNLFDMVVPRCVQANQ